MVEKFLFLIQIIWFVSIRAFDTIECTNNPQVANLTDDTVVLLESPNFPQSLPKSLCNAKFAGTNDTSYIWIAMLTGALEGITFLDDINYLVTKSYDNYNSNFDFITFSTYSNHLSVNVTTNDLQSWNAFKALVVAYSAEDELTSCPLNNYNFQFNSNHFGLVIPIINNYRSGDDYEPKECQWSFSIYPTQHLKIVVNKINIGEEVSLSLYSDGDLVMNFDNFDASKVYYVKGTSFELKYDFKSANATMINFSLLVSAVIPTNLTNPEGCQEPQIDPDNGKLSFSNVNELYGYPANQACSNVIKVPNNHEAFLQVTKFTYEACCDHLSVNFGDDQSEILTWRDRYPLNYVLTNDADGSTLQFLADGNTEGAGFTAEMQTYECSCADPSFVIGCNGTIYFYPMKQTQTYCSGMACNYNIVLHPDCPDLYFHLVIVNHLRPSVDFITLKNQDIVDQNVTAITGAVDQYFSPKSDLTVEFYSNSFTLPIVAENKFWNIYVEPILAPKFTKKVLSLVNPKQVLWLPDMNVGDAYTVCTTEKLTLELYSTWDIQFRGGSNFILYDSDDLEFSLGDLNQLPDPTNPSIARRIKSTSGCFTLYLSSYPTFNNQNTLLFKVFNSSTPSCENEANVYQITYDEAYDVSSKASASSYCEMIILSFTAFPQEIPHIWIGNVTADDGATYLVESNDKRLFEIKGSEVDEWQSIGIYTLALTITIPPSKQITLHFTSTGQSRLVYTTCFCKISASVNEEIQVVSSGVQRGIMVSPSYCGIKQSFSTTKLYYLTGEMSFLTYTYVKDVFGSPKPMIDVYPPINQTLLQNTSLLYWNFGVTYAENNPEANGFLVEYIIQGGVPIETTSTSLDYTSTDTSETHMPINMTSEDTTIASKLTTIYDLSISGSNNSEGTSPTAIPEISSTFKPNGGPKLKIEILVFYVSVVFWIIQ